MEGPAVAASGDVLRSRGSLDIVGGGDRKRWPNKKPTGRVKSRVRATIGACPFVSPYPKADCE